MRFLGKLFRSNISHGGDGIHAPQFVETLKRGVATYQVYRCENAEVAKNWLLSQKISAPNYHLFVQTNDGSWGIDIKGLYLEQIRPFQLNAAASCAGEFDSIDSQFGFEMHCRGITDNFIANIGCGQCKLKWKDGVRVSKATVVKCPKCDTLNKIDLTNLTVDIL